MILHISIDAHHPLGVATALAEVLHGKVYKCFTPGSYLVIPFDNYGTHIVVFKQGNVWVPGNDAEAARIIETEPSKLVYRQSAIFSIAPKGAKINYLNYLQGDQLGHHQR